MQASLTILHKMKCFALLLIFGAVCVQHNHALLSKTGLDSELGDDVVQWLQRRQMVRDWMSKCTCARKTMDTIRRLVRVYSAKVDRRRPTALDDVIREIKETAYNCTRKAQCQCPEGYMKTVDGDRCLKMSQAMVSCDDAANICAGDVNARLAVAKDNNALTKLADSIRDLYPGDEEFYWIGLSYNRTRSGIPVWTWEDGTTATYDITKNLKTNIKKSLLRIIDTSTGPAPTLQRVAISKDYEGTHWKQEACGRNPYTNDVVLHKYICEFMMFRVEIHALV